MKNTIHSFLWLFLALSISSVTVTAQEQSKSQVKQWINNNTKKLGLQSSDLAELEVVSASTNKKLTFAYAQQYYLGLKVHNAIYSLCFDTSGNIVSSTNRFINKINTKASDATPSIEAFTAIGKAAAYLKLPPPMALSVLPDTKNTNTYIIFTPAGIAKQDIIAELLWVTIDDGKTVRLAWNITIDELNSSDYMNVRVDAINGNVIDADNATVHEKKIEKDNTQQKKSTYQDQIKKNECSLQLNGDHPDALSDASYKVIPLPTESPSFGPLAIVTDPWLNAGAGNPVTVFGWQSNGVTEYNYTRGNNVFAYDDTAAADHPGHSDTSSTASPNFSFVKTPDFTKQPHVTNNMRAATTNLFYVTNMMHDISYQYGFDEPSGNFQVNNNGRGGLGNDPLKAEAQDGSGTDNANMSTQPDGQSPRMQMYLWDPPPSSITVNTPAAVAGNYTAVEGAFSTNNLLTAPLTGTAVYFNDMAASTHLGCVSPSNSLTGKIAFIDRGNCNFTVKVKDAQTAGAIAVIMVDNAIEAPFAMGGTDNTITIPAFMISETDGDNLITQISAGESITLHPSPPMLDGDYDDGVIAHEFTHGISNRLTGGPANTSCLANAEQGGEGWSDYMALMVTQNWATTTLADSLIQRPLGTYVLGETTTDVGLRTYPYTLNFSADPHTYADMNGTANGSEVHYIGEIWASTLWDMTWRIIQQEGSIEPNIYNASSTTGGNVIALNDVITGMKLQPCSPGYLDARDAILKADSLLYNNRHRCAIWAAFARRGMGYSAQQGSSNSTSDQVAAYDVPTAIVLSKIAADSLNANDTITYTINATCGCAIPTNIKIIDTLPATLNYTSSSSGTLSGNILTINPVSFTQPSQTLSYTVKATPAIAGCPINYLINDNRDAATTGGFTTTGGWAVSTIKSASPTHSWFAAEPTTASNITLTSASIILSNTSLFSFNHYFNTENTYDGGVVEISTDGGSTWQDLGSKITKGGYTTTMDASTILAGKQAFSGASNSFEHTTIDLSSFTGQTVLIRFRFETDNGNSTTVEGWYVDDIKLTSGCLVENSASLYNNSTLSTTSSALTFIKPDSLSTTIDSFSAVKVAGLQQAKISWTISNETNVARYKIYRSVNGVSFSIDTTANTNSTNYTVFDTNPAIPDTNYYKLEVINNDSSVTNSTIQFVIFSDTTTINAFTATKIAGQQKAAISWTINNETNAIEYQIERSIDNSTWTVIDTTISLGHINYNTVDSFPVIPGVNYYRLKLINYDSSINYSNVQPVSFTDTTVINTFSANKVNNQTEILWTINGYSNAGEYEIERSTNGTTWIVIDTTTDINNINYNITDSTPAIPGIDYYRLKIINTDSSFNYSAVIPVNFADTSTPRLIYSLAPNPANDHVQFIDKINEPVSIELYDGVGKLAMQESTNSNTEISIRTLAAGLYYYKVKTPSGDLHSGKLIITR
jgi:extracellular elastinolytic metalloproteinase